jgi:CelD/BcsL family acetyltransferase involved in cellulose biosynthesis
MKKGLKQTIRTSINKLAKEGRSWEVTRLASGRDALKRGLDELVELNRARAQRLPGRIQHRDVFSGPTEPFLREAAEALRADGSIAMWGLSIDGQVVARLFGLTANRSVYMLISGFDPAYWRYAPMSLLQWEALRECARLGYEVANLATGVAPTKLRWSDRLEVHNRFVMVGSRLRSRIAFAVFWHLRAASLLRNARALARNYPDGQGEEEVAQLEQRDAKRERHGAEAETTPQSAPVVSGG